MDQTMNQWREFVYGKTCIYAASPEGRALAWVGEKARNLVKGAALAAASLSLATALYASPQVVFGGALSKPNMSAPGISSQGVIVVPEVRREFVKARKVLRISQEEAAKMLRLSVATVQKFEQGVTESPSEETVNRYQAISKLASIYSDRFGTKSYLVRFYLREPSDVYSELSALEFSAAHEDGIFTVLGVESRRHA